MGLLGWAIAALVIALIAGLLGFGGIRRGMASIAKALFGVFMFIALVFFVLAMLMR